MIIFTFGKADCVDGQIRLMEGEGEWEGRLEICYNERWGTVGGDKWTQTNSDVVCKALGYGRSGRSTLIHISPSLFC